MTTNLYPHLYPPKERILTGGQLMREVIEEELLKTVTVMYKCSSALLMASDRVELGKDSYL